MREIKNAVIKGYRINIARGFALSLWLDLDYGGLYQGFGGYCLYHTTSGESKDYAGEFIAKTMQVVGVNDLADVVGKTIRVESDRCKVHRIGHIVKDEWFCPAEMFSDE